MSYLENKIKSLVEHWKKEDARGEEIKSGVDDYFIEMADFVNKNYDAFLKEPARYLKLLSAKYVNRNDKLFKNSVKSGAEFMEGVL